MVIFESFENISCYSLDFIKKLLNHILNFEVALKIF